MPFCRSGYRLTFLDAQMDVSGCVEATNMVYEVFLPQIDPVISYFHSQLHNNGILKIADAIFSSRQSVFPSEFLKLPHQSTQTSNMGPYSRQVIFHRIPLLSSQYSSGI